MSAMLCENKSKLQTNTQPDYLRLENCPIIGQCFQTPVFELR